VETVHSTPTAIGLRSASLDAALMIRVYNAVVGSSDDAETAYQKHAAPLLRSIRSALKPGGRLVVQDLESGVYEFGSVPLKVVLAHLKRIGGFRHVETKWLDRDRYLCVFERTR